MDPKEPRRVAFSGSVESSMPSSDNGIIALSPADKVQPPSKVSSQVRTGKDLGAQRLAARVPGLTQVDPQPRPAIASFIRDLGLKPRRPEFVRGLPHGESSCCNRQESPINWLPACIWRKSISRTPAEFNICSSILGQQLS